MSERPVRSARKNAQVEHMLRREQERQKMREIRKILKKAQLELTEEESKLLEEHSSVVQEIQKKLSKHHSASDKMKEVLDPPDILKHKCEELAEALKTANSAVFYTGAGISTAAHIPDYRGPDGVWTLLKKGERVQVQDLSAAEPTFTHMAIRQLYKTGLISHVVSQNCDGLHLRSGLPPKALSEIHGNMFIEVCTKCKPIRQYVRLFDVTENTGLHRHKTGRFCRKCRFELRDTIVHFGETGKIPWPLNWKGAAKAASEADVIVCLGSSLKVLKRYHCLWGMNRPPAKRPKLYIVNLQWTPKDMKCTLKINGKCDDVMEHLTSLLDIKVPSYKSEEDPIFKMAVPLTDREKSTTTRNEISLSVPAHAATVAKSEDNEDFKLTNACANMNESESELKKESKFGVHPADETSLEIQEENDGVPAKRQCPQQLTGWYGKGSAKWRRAKRKRLK